MVEREMITFKLQEYFENLWKKGDPWDLASAEYEQSKYAHELAMINERHYRRILEIGCGAGNFTRRLAQLAEQVVALDIAPSAIESARQTASCGDKITFQVADIMNYDMRAEGRWDLIVMSETIYCLGWLYPFFDIGWLAAELFAATCPGGRFLMTNTQGKHAGALVRPWLIRTYHDLFLHVGYQLEAEEVFRGMKNGVNIESLSSLFIKAPEDAAERDSALW